MTAKKAIQALIATVVMCLCTSVSHAEDIKLFLMEGARPSSTRAHSLSGMLTIPPRIEEVARPAWDSKYP